ncbi:MAG: hypothetical protein JRF71_14030 [Deltaproteobacteria bacterium]|nr:hypothetical protein [Deltaproteobacteria bacterium]
MKNISCRDTLRCRQKVHPVTLEGNWGELSSLANSFKPQADREKGRSSLCSNGFSSVRRLSVYFMM